MSARTVTVCLAVECEVEGDATPTDVGIALCGVTNLPQFHTNFTIVTPTAIAPIRSSENEATVA